MNNRTNLLRASLPGALLAIALAAGSAGNVEAQSQGLKIGDRAPTAIVESLDGEPVDLARFIGKSPVLIEFWATWCPLCRELEPTIEELHERYRGQLEIVRVGVPQNQTPEGIRAYVQSRGLPGHFFFDGDGAAYKAFAAYYTSYIVVLDRNGRVVHSDAGTEQDLKAAVARAVGEPRG